MTEELKCKFCKRHSDVFAKAKNFTIELCSVHANISEFLEKCGFIIGKRG